MKAKNTSTDIVIIGAGMAGLTLAGLLGKNGFAVTVVDREDPEKMALDTYDVRTIALSLGSRQIMEPLGIWDALAPFGVAIESIDVQEGHDPFLLNFDAGDIEHKAFGWIFPNAVVRRMLYDAAVAHHVQFAAPDMLQDIVQEENGVIARLASGHNIHASVLIGVDGRTSRVRDLVGVSGVNLPYHQCAWVGLVEHENPHHGLAVERFYNTGPFAILPFTNRDPVDGEAGVPIHRSAIVWTHDVEKGQTHLPVPDLETLTSQLEQLFDERYGAIKAVGTWGCFPLSLYHAKEMVAPRVALASDAAHAIHPIAGQGLNLGMRDLQVLTELFTQARDRGDDIGSVSVLAEYQRQRRFDIFAMVAATDVLNRLFGTKSRSVRWLRSAGLGVVNRVPTLKKFFMNVASGK